MSAFSWSQDPGANAAVDPNVPARDGASARDFPALVRGVQAGVAGLIAAQGGALVSTGTLNVYAIDTGAGVTPGPGVSVSFWADRDNTDAPTLSIDGSGPLPWRGADGLPLPPGAVQGGLLYTVAWNAVPGAPREWRSVAPAAGAPAAGISPDHSGTLDQRSAYDNAAQGTTYLAVADTPLGPTWTLYLKRSIGFADWSSGLAIKASPAQSTADAEAASTLAQAAATTAVSARDTASSGAQTSVAQAARAVSAATDAAFQADKVISAFLASGPVDQLPVPNMTARGAVGNGVADNLAIFRDAPRTTPYSAPPGSYALSSTVNDASLRLELPRPGVTFTAGAGRLYATIDRPHLYRPGRSQLAHLIEKMRSGAVVTGAVRGDSLSWGLYGDGAGNPSEPTNGYTGAGTRSSITVRQALQAALRSVYQYNASGGQSISVLQQGYPGDRSYEMLNRWEAFDAANTLDFCVLMIGTNDSTTPYSMIDFIRYYRETIERLREKGTAIILVAPPPSPTLSSTGQAPANALIYLYREAATRLAREYNLPLVDAAVQLRQLGAAPWYSAGDVHLSTPAYQLLGWDISTLLTPLGGLLAREVGPGMAILGVDMPCDGYGGHIAQAAYPVSRSGYVIQVDPNYTLTIPVFVKERCVPVFEIISPDTGKQRHLTYSRIGADTVVGVFDDFPEENVARRGYAGPVLEPGWRLLQFKGAGANAAFLDAVQFRSTNERLDGGGAWRRSQVSGWARTVWSGGNGTGGTYSRELLPVTWVHRVRAHVRLGSGGRGGLSLTKDNLQNLATGSPNKILVYRDGADLKALDLVTNASGVMAGFFTSNDVWDGELSYEITSPDPTQAKFNVFANGTFQFQIVPSFTGGYVGMTSLEGPHVCECVDMQVCEG